MLDINFIRGNAKEVQEKSNQKGYKVDIGELIGLDNQRRTSLSEVEKLRASRNDQASSIKAGKPTEQQLAQGKTLKDKLSQLESQLEPIETAFQKLYRQVPNMPLDEVPVGAGEAQNVVIKTIGEPTKFAFKAKNHAVIANSKGWLDKERATKVAGSRFAYIKGDLVKLQFAIVQYVLDTLTDQSVIDKILKDNDLNISNRPFVPVLPPVIVNTVAYEATARLNAEEETYKLADDEMWLNASAEHSLCNMYMGEIIPTAQLPIRYIGYATSFRREAGSYGKDTEGIFRMHQFDKLEMQVFSDAQSGYNEHKFLLAIQQYLLDQLQLPYQIIQKCTGDIGRPNAQGVDINTWLPSQQQYRETHSADYMTDYQGRRLQTKYKSSEGKTDYVHTNDATALVLSRIPAAIIENFQTENGDVVIPKVLQKYLAGIEKI